MLQPAKRRSKTCIIVKNLPAKTEKEEIRVLFEKHGQIARFLMPNHGITALVDFIEPYEAKKAFSKLAYSQFKTAPLYLEWAPENVFVKAAEKPDLNSPKESEDRTASEVKSESTEEENVKTINSSKEEEKDESADETEDPENDTTLFVKNLNFTTNEETLKSVSVLRLYHRKLIGHRSKLTCTSKTTFKCTFGATQTDLYNLSKHLTQKDFDLEKSDKCELNPLGEGSVH